MSTINVIPLVNVATMRRVHAKQIEVMPGMHLQARHVHDELLKSLADVKEPMCEVFGWAFNTFSSHMPDGHKAVLVKFSQSARYNQFMWIAWHPQTAEAVISSRNLPQVFIS